MTALDERRKAILEAMNKETDEKIHSWEELFAKLNRAFSEWSACKCDAHMLDAMMNLYGFMKAMENLPEEGDVVAIAKEMNKAILEKAPEVGIVLLSDKDNLAEVLASEFFNHVMEEDLASDRKIH